MLRINEDKTVNIDAYNLPGSTLKYSITNANRIDISRNNK